jgi:hypothetical protein
VNRMDERKGTGASLARTPAEAKEREDKITGHVSTEHDDPMDKPEGEDSSMARSRGAAHAGAERHEREERAEEGKRGKDEVSSGRGIKHEMVEADHVIGTGGDVGTSSAEGEPDMASAKANRKEAMEPEREENEKAAMGRERSVPAKNVIGHGERETIARHTI